MSVLIKRMKMPISCERCPMLDWDLDYIKCKVTDRHFKMTECWRAIRVPDCPLAEPPSWKVQQWISVEDELPPPDQFREYLVRVRSGGPLYGGWEYHTDLAWWSEYRASDGAHGYDWNSILTDWDGDVTITHWMPIPDLPEESE